VIGCDVAKKTKTKSVNARTQRLYFLGCASVLWVGLLTWRLLNLQVFSFETWSGWASKQHFGEVEISSERGPIYDRNKKALALSVPASSIFIRPKLVKNKEEAARVLSSLLSVDRKELHGKLVSGKPFVWVKRQIPRSDAELIEELKIPGVGSLLEAKRYYPYNQAAAQLVGKVGIDGQGLTGLEILFDKKLHSTHQKFTVERDAVGNIIQTSATQSMSLPKGEAVQLTIDADMQLILDEELERGRIGAKAKGALGVLIDTETGEILAMGQSPTINLNTEVIADKKALRNRIFETVIEPGSIIKPIVAASAIDLHEANSTDMINCENGRYSIGKHTIKDVHPSGVISLHDVVVRSSNIGMTKIGMRLGKERLYHELRKFGFGGFSGLNFPGETRGILRKPENWALVDVATHSFGQGVAVTPLQMVRAISALSNKGVLPTLKLIEDGKKIVPGDVILSERAAQLGKEMMYGVVEEDHGTGKLAKISGVKIGGKTGTAQKARANGKGYEPGAYVASFAGFAEANEIGIDQKLSLVVMIDEPQGGVIYGGALAAPVFKRVMIRTLQHLAMKNSNSIPTQSMMQTVSYSQ